MVLKEAFRYQNYLTLLIDNGLGYLGYSDNVVSKKQEHLRNKSNPEAENEILVVPKDSDLEHTPNDVIDFVLDVLDEKEKLSKAIDKAKLNATINMDSSVALNKQKQCVINTLKQMASIKSSERTLNGIGYKFNADGNQVSYNYTIKEIKTIDFDRNKVKGVIKRLNKETDKISSDLDKLMVTLEVDYTPKYDVNDSFEDSLRLFRPI